MDVTAPPGGLEPHREWGVVEFDGEEAFPIADIRRAIDTKGTVCAITVAAVWLPGSGEWW